MGLFNRNKKILIPNESSYDIVLNLKDAVQFANEMKIKLNFTNESISRLDVLLLAYFNDFKQYPVEMETIQNTAKIFGTYLGEVIRRNWLFDYVWHDNTNGAYRHPILEKQIDANTIFCIDPVDEVLQRMLNGESVSTYKYFREIQRKAVSKEL